MIMLIRFLSALLFLLVVTSCENTAKQEGNDHAEHENVASNEYVIEVISAPGGGYGYEIFVGEIKLISQPHRPGVTGIEGFRTRSDAEKVAALVVAKMKRNQMPPTVSKKELDSLNID